MKKQRVRNERFESSIRGSLHSGIRQVTRGWSCAEGAEGMLSVTPGSNLEMKGGPASCHHPVLVTRTSVNSVSLNRTESPTEHRDQHPCLLPATAAGPSPCAYELPVLLPPYSLRKSSWFPRGTFYVFFLCLFVCFVVLFLQDGALYAALTVV